MSGQHAMRPNMFECSLAVIESLDSGSRVGRQTQNQTMLERTNGYARWLLRRPKVKHRGHHDNR